MLRKCDRLSFQDLGLKVSFTYVNYTRKEKLKKEEQWAAIKSISAFKNDEHPPHLQTPRSALAHLPLKCITRRFFLSSIFPLVFHWVLAKYLGGTRLPLQP